MKKGLLGEKVGMLQVWTESGKRETVTAVKAGPCPIVQIKTPEKDGYAAYQIGYGETGEKSQTKAGMGHQKAVFEKNNSYCKRLIELRDYESDKAVGDTLSCDIFEPGEKVMVRGTSKGKGFQGVVKRHNFGGGRATHGSHFHRAPGSVGAGTDPARIGKGKKMPGRMGGKTKTSINLEIVRVIPEENVILVRGSVPGPRGSKVFIYQ